MTHEELLQLIAEVQRHQSELDSVEVKTAQGGTPKRIFESLSAFANRDAGGAILLGLERDRKYQVVGVGDAERLQEDISGVPENMEPPLRPEFTVGQADGKTVIAVEVPSLAMQQRPCFFRPAGLQGGSYIRVGNTNRQMTGYEIFGYISAREQPVFDQEPVLDATVEDLDSAKLEEYVVELRRARPRAAYLGQPLEQLLERFRIIRRVDGALHPTLAGLLMFGNYPQEFEPQLVITFLQYYGTTETEPTPRGERFLDNRKFEGPLPQVVEDAVNYVLAALRKSSLIEGLFRRDVPEYPEEAVREAVINAVAHRDYSQYVRGTYIQIRLFADRLEVQSPGGLYGNVTVETLDQEQSTRNRILVRLMEDIHLVENRGSGINTMIEAMRKANLEPPRFQDRRLSFWVTFSNYTLMSPEAIAWLNQFAPLPLNNQQRLALVYLRHNKRITNNEYQRLNHVDSDSAYRELKGLMQDGMIEPHGVGRWTYYTLLIPEEISVLPARRSDEDRVLAYARERDSITRAQMRSLGFGEGRIRYLLRKLSRDGPLRAIGTWKNTRYVVR